jgi:hypothetical protein
MGRFDKLFNTDPAPETVASLPTNQQTGKPTSQQTNKESNQFASKPVNQQTSKEGNGYTSKPRNQQTSAAPLSTKEKKKYSTYLREDSILDIQVRSAQARKKDHELLQEIVDYYFKNSKN